MFNINCADFTLLLSAKLKVFKRRADSYDKYVKTLPLPDKVDILTINLLPLDNPQSIDCSDPKILCHPLNGLPVKMLNSISLKGRDAEKVATLWRRLEPGNGMGCFGPAYLLRFYNQDKLLLDTEVCFHCCNITLPNYGIVSICGNKRAFNTFKKSLTGILPLGKSAQDNRRQNQN